MPPPQPLLSEQAAFSRHLFIQGYPLWSPDPDLLPPDRQNVGLRIGDVGAIDERGRFDLFFNIIESLPGSVSFTPIEVEARCNGEDILPREVVSSPETPWEVEQVDLLEVPNITRRTTEYGATLSDDGAHIVLPQGAKFYELGPDHRRLFENHARENGAKWLQRFRTRLEPPRSSSIYLLTGLYQTCSWLMEVDERLIRESSVWQPTGRFKRKIGPPPERQGRNNQTVFIRAITITPNLSKQRSGEQYEVELFGIPFPRIGFLNASARDSTSAAETDTSSGIIIQHVPQISQASHPSEIINRYLLTKEPSASIAVTHDSPWIEMLKSLEKRHSWTLEDLESNLDALVPVHYTAVTHDDVVYLTDKEHGAATDADADQSCPAPSNPETNTTPGNERNEHLSLMSPEHTTGPYNLELEVTDGSPLQDTMDWSPGSIQPILPPLQDTGSQSLWGGGSDPARSLAGGSQKGKLRDPNASKRPSSAYFLFLRHIRSDPLVVKDVFGDEQDTTKQSVLAAAKWRSMTDEERKPFLAQAEKDKLEYEVAQRLYGEGATIGNFGILPRSPSQSSFRTLRTMDTEPFSSGSESDAVAVRAERFMPRSSFDFTPQFDYLVSDSQNHFHYEMPSASTSVAPQEPVEGSPSRLFWSLPEPESWLPPPADEHSAGTSSRPYSTVQPETGRGVVPGYSPPQSVHSTSANSPPRGLSEPSISGWGPLIPQERYQISDTLTHNQQQPITFDLENPDQLGIPIIDILNKTDTFRRLRDGTQPFDSMGKKTFTLRIHWPGYKAWSKTFAALGWTKKRAPITHATLAEAVAIAVRVLLEKYRDVPCDPAYAEWNVGPKGIQLDQLCLVAIHRVSKGSLQPVLCLIDPRR